VYRHDGARDRPGPQEPTAARPAALPPLQANALKLQRQAGNRATRSIARFDVSDLRVPLIGTLVGGLAGMIGSGVVWRQGFLEHAHAVRRRPIFRSEWDAWGHCMTAAMTASRGTSAEAWLLGEGREWVQDHTTGQDSHAEDSHNQGVGRAIGSRLGWASADVLIRESLQAYDEGRLRIGPDRETAWLPWCGDGFRGTVRHEGRRWFNAHGRLVGNPGEWVEAIDCGPRGRTVGGHLDYPRTPIPEGSEV
jgi:hypothetical protein